MKVRIQILVSVIIGQILPQREKEKIARRGAQLIPIDKCALISMHLFVT
jgi:hypothetical protein